jgi:predicted permease
MNDWTFALRQLRKTPVFTIVAVVSLALGIGASTAIFSLVNEFLLRSLPVRSPEELVLFRAVHGAQGRMSRRGEGPGSIDAATGRPSSTPLSLLIFERFRTERSPLSEVFAFAPFSQVHVLVSNVPETAASAQFVSGNYYRALGVAAILGRTITSDDDQPSASPVAVISYRFWERRFAGDTAVLGQTIAINKVAATIVGVTPPGFEGAMQAGETVDISVPLAHHIQFQPDRAERAEPWYWWVRVMGRLAPGAEAAQARATLEPLFQRAAREGWLASQTLEPNPAMPDDPILAADPGAQGENDVRRQYARSLRILLGLVGLVLVAACANVANLLVARGDTRRREVALRLALGARRGQIVRQLFIESLLLAFAGAALGIIFAWWGRDGLLALRPFGTTTVVLDLPLDASVLGFTLVIAVAATLIAGLPPALRATRVELAAQFGGARTLGGDGRSRLRHGLMVLQIALSLVLLVSTGLFVRTIAKLESVDPGFNIRNLVLFRIDATSAGYTRDRFATLHARVQTRLERLPGVAGVTFSRVALLSRTRQNMTFSILGSTPAPRAAMNALTNGIASNFFAVMELPLVRGRGFTDGDHAAAPSVAVVNQVFAQTYFGDASPLGRQLVFSAPTFNRTVEIVGVARDAKYTDLRGGTPATVYFPALQQLDGTANFAIRTTTEPAAIFPEIRAAMREIDSAVPIMNLRTQNEQLERLHGQEQLFAQLSGFFGLVTLALACIGLYGLMSHTVARRASEIGLRIAVGARPGQMLRLVVGESLRVVCLGASVGVAAAYASSRFIASMLFGVAPTDPLTYGGVVMILIAVALAGTLVPAYDASRIEPMKALSADHSAHVR